MSDLMRDRNPKLHDRLVNFKFKSAMKYLEGEDDETSEVVLALGGCFGNVGWGLDGAIGIIVASALDGIGCTDR